mmetsp:Transcript_162003/g.514752  ORF Transcript_162003/g.514752 Transcript_162003/m.514752 type:complete len:228 (+) Transcript_162003:747-1430(+)
MPQGFKKSAGCQRTCQTTASSLRSVRPGAKYGVTFFWSILVVNQITSPWVYANFTFGGFSFSVSTSPSTRSYKSASENGLIPSVGRFSDTKVVVTSKSACTHQALTGLESANIHENPSHAPSLMDTSTSTFLAFAIVAFVINCLNTKLCLELAKGSKLDISVPKFISGWANKASTDVRSASPPSRMFLAWKMFRPRRLAFVPKPPGNEAVAGKEIFASLTGMPLLIL